MRKCLDCNCDISNRGNRACRCVKCQKMIIKEKQKEYNKKYLQSKKGKASVKKYQQSEKGIETRKEYWQSEKGKKICAKLVKKYRQSEKGKATMKKYRQLDKAKISRKKWRQSPKGRLIIKKDSMNQRQQHRKVIHNLKINGCAICGYDKCTECLDFHHVNPEDKKILVNVRGMSYSNNTIITEVNKCILLCANCHREIHSKEI